MQINLRYLIILFLFFQTATAWSFKSSNSDTIPPVFTQFASDLSINCTSSLTDVFSNWYDTAGGAQADNGEATVVGIITLEEALAILDSTHLDNCFQGVAVTYGFIALDSCNNQSIDTSFAEFEFIDNQPPFFSTQGQDVALDCDFGIQDSLQTWIDNMANAVVMDNCSDSLIIHNYNWTDSNGDSGFGDIGTPTSIVISRTTCLWYVDVTFFVSDLCNNLSNTVARFEIISDNNGPQLMFGPQDTILECTDFIPSDMPIFVDGCDGELTAMLSETNMQNADTLNCGYYHYNINRIWVATDACGNSSTHTQIISIVDTLGPEVEFDPIVAFDCDEDINDVDQLISVNDNCSVVSINFQDTIIASNICQEQLIRTWEFTDVCGNTEVVDQTIQVQDFSIPEFVGLIRDTIIDCGVQMPEAVFDEWLIDLLETEVTDNCSEVKKFVTRPGAFSDTLSIVNAPIPQLEIELCPTTNTAGVLGVQEVRLMTFDLCGNIAGRSAFFTIIDTIVPEITICPPNRGVTLEETFCSRNTRLLLPIIEDNCVESSTENWHINYEGERILFSDEDSIFVDLEVGTHFFDYSFTDCAGNVVSCSNSISVRDTFPPVLTCPQDVSIYVDNNACAATYSIENIEDYNDNCQGPLDYFETKPSGSGLVNFSYDNQDSLYRANDIILDFDNVSPEGIIFKPRLTIEYMLNISTGSSVTINSELGDILYRIEEADCEDQTVILDLNVNQFNFWAVDGSIKFTIVHDEASGEGTVPCVPENISGSQGNDQVSFIRISLEYSDIISDYILSEADTGQELNTPQSTVSLDVGRYELKYSSLDRNNNEGSCSTFISIIDTIAPDLSCDDIVLISPVGLDNIFSISESDLDFSTADNCGIDSVVYSPQTFECARLDSSMMVQIEVFDVNGNVSRCDITADIISEPLSLSFSSNLCFADTLKLFAGIDDALVVSYDWTGPADFESDQANPVLNNIDNTNSGIYRLTVETTSGCIFRGDLDIQVNDFVSPQIFVDSTSYCFGELVLFNASIYSEEVDYFWYEGVSPNGILIQQTDGPSIQLTPSLGEHFYYVEVRSEECASNPSNTISIDILPQPTASVEQPFITVCEGDEIILSSSDINPEFTYLWTGPNGYSSEGAIPEIISNASNADQGNYLLMVTNGNCISDTAVAQVVVFELPQTPVISGDNIFCEGQSAVLTVSNVPNAVRYHWYKDGILFSSVFTNSLLIPSINQSHSGNWTVIAEEGLCSSAESGNFNVFVESSLNIGASNNGPLCEGDFVNLTSSFIPNATYRWEDPAGIFYQGREISVLAVEGIYSVTVTTSSNCTATTTTEVEVATRPQITALSNTSLTCMTSDMSVTFVPTVFPPGSYIYEWSGPQGFESSTRNPVLNNITEAQNGIYSLVIKSGNCVSDTVTTTLNLNLIPPAPVLNGNTEPCEGDSLLLTVSNPVTDGIRSWIWTTPVGQFVTNEPRLLVTNFNDNNVGAYFVHQERNTCRSNQSNILNIDFLDNPEKPLIQGMNTLCQGDDLILTTPFFDLAEYIWFTPSGTVTTSTNQLVIEEVDLQVQGLYSVEIKRGNCRSEKSSAINIRVKERPDAPFFGHEVIELCENEDILASVCFTSSPVNAEGFQIIDIQTGIKIQEGVTGCFDLSFLNVGLNRTYNLVARAENEGCFSETSDTLEIRIFEIPSEKALIEDKLQIICNQEFANARIESAPMGISWEWTSPDPELNIFDANSDQASFSNLREGNNQIILRSSNGLCENYDADTSRIFVVNEIIANDDFYEESFSGSVLINVLDNDIFNQQVTIVDISTPGEGQASIRNNLIEYTAPASYVGQVSMDYEICYDECPDFCATATLEIKIGDNIECFAGNVMTPNGDGYNDLFEIPCLDTGNYPTNELTIFNQWGDEIFNAGPYLNNWDGRFNGEVLPVGTYFYILDLGDGSNALQGFIIIEL